MIYVILTLLLIIFIFSGYIFFKITKLREINNSLEICTNNISDTLNKKYEIIDSILKKIDNDKLNKDFEYKSDGTIYEREKALFDISFSINKYLKSHKNKAVDEEFNKLNQIEETLDGLKDFYNAHVLKYNEIFLKRYVNKIYKLFKLKDYKSFKMRKLDEYEIFKI